MGDFDMQNTIIAGALQSGAALGDVTFDNFSTTATNTFVGTDAGGNTVGIDNTFVGADAGESNTTGNDNTFVGFRAGQANTTGQDNTFVGSQAGLANTTAGDNVFVGGQCGLLNTSGGNNTFVGSQAGLANTCGSNNTYMGNQSGVACTTAVNNTFVGNQSGVSNTSGGNNTFVGQLAGRSNTTGIKNTFIGKVAGGRNMTGIENTMVGFMERSTNPVLNPYLHANNCTILGVQEYSANPSTATDCVTIGRNAGNKWSEVNRNISIGNEAMGQSSGTITAGVGRIDDCICIGHQAGNSMLSIGGVPTTDNICIGSNAGNNLISGIQNTIIGSDIAPGNLATNNTCVGYQAGSANFGNQNTHMGSFAGLVNFGADNTCIGFKAGQTGFGSNTCVGSQAGGTDLPGGLLGSVNNTLIGIRAGLTISGGAGGNTVMGHDADVSIAAATERIVIGKDASGTVDNGLFFPTTLAQVAPGATTIFDAATGQMGPTTSSRRFKENIGDIDVDSSLVYTLEPRSFNYTNNPNQRLFGLIAEEVNEVFPTLVPKDKDGQPFSVRYDVLSVLLLTELKKVRKELDEVKNRLF